MVRNPLLACITWQLHSSSFHSQCCREFLLVEIYQIQECASQIQCTIVLAFGCRSKHTCEYCIVSITCSTKMHSALPCMSTTCRCFSVCQTVMLNGRCWHLLTSADICWHLLTSCDPFLARSLEPSRPRWLLCTASSHKPLQDLMNTYMNMHGHGWGSPLIRSLSQQVPR